MNVLKGHKEDIGWCIDDNKGTTPSIVMHKIHLEENAQPSNKSQRCLHPIMQDVVKN